MGERIEVQLNDGTWVRRVVATAPALQRVEGGTIHAIFVAGYPLPVPLGRCRRLAGRRA